MLPRAPAPDPPSAAPRNSPLSPDSQAFMDMLERHLSEHDNSLPAQPPPKHSQQMDGFPSFTSAAATTYQPPATKQTPPALQQQGAPSPHTMAALINILQIQAQSQGLSPQEQQRNLVNMLNTIPHTSAGDLSVDSPASAPRTSAGAAGVTAEQMNAFAASMLYPSPPVYNNPTPSGPQQQQTHNKTYGYPYPGIDTPEHSVPGSTGGARGKSTDLSVDGDAGNGDGTPPGSSSPEAGIRAPPPRVLGSSSSNNATGGGGPSRGDNRAPVEHQRRALDNVLEAQARTNLDSMMDRQQASVAAASRKPSAKTTTTTTTGEGAMVKRKAGDEGEGHQSHRSRPSAAATEAGQGGGDSNEDDSEGDDHDSPPVPTGKKNSSRRAAAGGGGSGSSRRKSTALTSGGPGETLAGKGDEDLDAKALKRKNQNRAAQKAFRERREARVKDLEDKVSELEARNAGNEFENENLRQLLAKLQQENMALKNTAFTFSMPMVSTATNNNNLSSSAVRAKSQSPPSASDPAAHRFSPPQPYPIQQHRGDSTSSSASGISNTVRSGSGGGGSGSVPTTRSPGELSGSGSTHSIHSASASPLGGPRTNVFNPEPYNAFASSTTTTGVGVGAAQGQQQQQQQQSASVRNTVSPPIDQSHRRAGFESHGNSFTPSSGVNLVDQTMASVDSSSVLGGTSGGGGGGASNEMDWQNLLNNNFTMLAQAPEFMSFSDDAAFGNFAGFSDIWPGFSGQDFSTAVAAFSTPADGPSGDGQGAGDTNMTGIQSTLLDNDTAAPATGSSINQFNTLQSKSSAVGDDSLISMDDDNMEEFLRSLGAGAASSSAADDVFDMNFIDSNASDESAAAGSELYKQFIAYKSSPAANTGVSSSLSSAPSSILSPSNYFTNSPDASSASSVSAHNINNQKGTLPNHASSESPDKQASTNSNESAFRVGTFGGSVAADHKPMMVRRDGTLVTCDKVWEVVATKFPINSGFDLDDLCDRFKQKAVCTGHGAQFKEEEADAILAEYAAERQLKQQIQQQQQAAAAGLTNHSQPAGANNAMFFQ